MQLLNPQKVSPRTRWLRRVAWLGFAFLAVGAWLAYHPAVQRYHLWKQERALGRARDFLAQKDPASAQLELQIALTAVPGSPAAIRVAAELLEQVGSAQALDLRRRVVAASPHSTNDRVALATLALRLRDFNAAREALAGIDPAQATQPDVLRAQLAYALATDNRPVADALFDRLAALGLQTDDTQALHVMLLRQHPNPEKSAAAKKEFAALALNPKFSLTVNRTLAAEAIAAKDFPAAKRLAALVSAHPAATFGDRLNEASLQLLVDQQPFAGVFARLAPLAAARGPTGAEFVRWLLVQGKADDADRWVATLPPALAATPDIATVRAEIASVTKDWDRFSQLLETGAWGPVPKEVVQLAMAAHVLDGRSPALRKAAWTEALAAAGANLPAHGVLLRIAQTWQWDDETEQVLWAIVHLDPSQVWAHTALINVFRQRGDGVKMLGVVSVLHNAATSSSTYHHDWALLTMLVAPTANWDSPKVTAKELYLADPTNPSYATAYALALTQAGKADEARLILEKLPLADREYPVRAAYLAFVYGHCRRRTEFEKYAALAAPAHLLKEERVLIAAGERALTRSTPPPADSRRPKPEPALEPKPAAKT